MAEWRFVNIEGKEVKFLGDLKGIEIDLTATIDICTLLVDELNKDLSVEHITLLDALSVAALVRYFRCFASGVRAPLPKKLLDGMTKEMREDHEWFKALRNKYIAHSVNSFEENQVNAYLYPEERGKKEVTSISVLHARLVSLGSDEVNCLKKLCGYFLEKVKVLAEVENEKCLKYVRALSVDELYKKKAEAPQLGRKKDAFKRRR